MQSSRMIPAPVAIRPDPAHKKGEKQQHREMGAIQVYACVSKHTDQLFPMDIRTVRPLVDYTESTIYYNGNLS